MTLETVYWLIPGYFCLLVYYGYQGIRHQGTWDFLIKLAPASAACSFLAQLIAYWLSITPEITIGGYGTAGFAGSNEILFAISLVLAVPIGLVSPWIISWLFYMVEKIRIKWGMDSKTEQPNLVSWHCSKLLSKKVQVSTKSGKVYSGYLLAYSSDDKVPGIIIAPFISGYRMEDLTVEFNTTYIRPKEDITSMKRRELLIPFSEICSIAEFDLDFHLNMIGDGTLKWKLPVASDESADTKENQTKSQ